MLAPVQPTTVSKLESTSAAVCWRLSLHFTHLTNNKLKDPEYFEQPLQTNVNLEFECQCYERSFGVFNTALTDL